MILLVRLWLICLLAASHSAAAAPLQDREVEQLIGQGQQAMTAGQPGEAAVIFERIVMEQPWRLGVWLDYALALEQSGEPEAARAIYRRLVDENPPEHLRPWLQQRLQEDTPESGWRTAGQLALHAGYDSNLNRAPAVDSLVLTLPAGPAILPLADSARASGGAAGLLSAAWMAAPRAGEGEDWLVQAALNARLAPEVAGQDYIQFMGGVMRRWSQPDEQEWLGAVSLRHLRYGGVDMQRTLRTGLYRGRLWDRDGESCTGHLGAEWEMNTYPIARLLDGNYLGLAADIGCARQASWQMQLRAGMDKAEHARAGGDQWQLEWRGQLGGKLGKAGWTLEAGYRHQRDTRGYSRLLANNAVRAISTATLRGEIGYPLTQGWQGLLSLESFRQDSNLDLFRVGGETGWLGLRRSF